MNLQALNNMPNWEWPDGAGKFLLKKLKDKKVALTDRILAAELAGDVTVINDELALTLLNLIPDANEPLDLRRQAPLSLGAVLEYIDMDEKDYEDADPEEEVSLKTYKIIRGKLKDYFFDEEIPEEIRQKVLESSVRSKMPWHKEAVEKAYASTDPDWKLTAVYCMSYIKGFEKEIMESLNHENPLIVYEAVRAAGNFSLTQAWPIVKKLLQDKKTEPTILIAAIGAAATINPQEAADYLIKYAESDNDDVAEAANEAMIITGMIQSDDLDDFYDDSDDEDDDLYDIDEEDDDDYRDDDDDLDADIVDSDVEEDLK